LVTETEKLTTNNRAIHSKIKVTGADDQPRVTEYARKRNRTFSFIRLKRLVVLHD